MKISIKKISGLVSVLVLGLFLASCAGKNEKTIIVKYENGQPAAGMYIDYEITSTDVKKLQAVAKKEGWTEADWKKYHSAIGLYSEDTNAKGTLLRTDKYGKAVLKLLPEFAGVKFSGIIDLSAYNDEYYNRIANVDTNKKSKFEITVKKRIKNQNQQP